MKKVIQTLTHGPVAVSGFDFSKVEVIDICHGLAMDRLTPKLVDPQISLGQVILKEVQTRRNEGDQDGAINALLAFAYEAYWDVGDTDVVKDLIVKAISERFNRTIEVDEKLQERIADVKHQIYSLYSEGDSSVKIKRGMGPMKIKSQLRQQFIELLG